MCAKRDIPPLHKRAVYAALFLGLGFSLSCGKIAVKGKVEGTQNSSNSDIYEKHIDRGSLETVGNERVVRFNGTQEGQLFDDFESQLRLDITGNPNQLSESYLFINTFQPDGQTSGGACNDRSFIVNAVGGSIFQRIRRGDPLQEVNVNSRQHLGFGYLAVVADNDRSVPWRIEFGQDDCFDAGNNDCLDMETISRDLYENVSDGVREAVRGLWSASVFFDELIYVPNVKQDNFENEGRRARGFAFVYHAKIEMPTIVMDAYVPLSFIFADDVNSYVLFVDPLSLRSDLVPQPQNLDRVFVNGSFLFEGMVRDTIVNTLRTMDMPETPGNVPFEEFVLLGINIAAGRNADLTGSPPHTSPTYNFLLAPEEPQNTLTSMGVWQRFRSDETQEVTRIRLHIIE